MSICDWPEDERPRERLIAQGPAALSDAELLAVFLRVGVKGKSAVDLARDCLQNFGSLRRMFAAPLAEYAVTHHSAPPARKTTPGLYSQVPPAAHPARWGRRD